MNTSRLQSGCVLLNDGTVGLFGGFGGATGVALATAEVYQP
jgi:hypothetical protein